MDEPIYPSSLVGCTEPQAAWKASLPRGEPPVAPVWAQSTTFWLEREFAAKLDPLRLGSGSLAFSVSLANPWQIPCLLI